jgi:autotransporter-associated beta strand protein
MKAPATRNRWSPLRSLLLVACAGGLLAAAHTWMTNLRFDFDDASDWWSNISPADIPSAEIVAAPEIVNSRAPELSMGQLVNGVLFSKPATGWQLDSTRTDFTAAWMTPQSNGSWVTQTHSDYRPATLSPSGFATGSSPASSLVPTAPTASGNWISNATGIWGSTTNWQGGVIADGAGNTAHFDTLDITTPLTVLLDTSRTIGNLYIGDTNGTDRYTIAPTSSILTFDTGTSNPSIHSILEQSSTSLGDTIHVSVFMNSDLDINNLSGANQFTISGNISANSIRLLSFNNIDTSIHTAGNILVSGIITNGTSGPLSLVVVNGGTVTLSGTNTYTGSTEVKAGTLLINGNNSGASGGTHVDNSGTLGGHGTVGGNNFVFGGTVTGDTITTVGTLSFAGSLTFGGEGPGGTYLANLNGALSDRLAITLNLTIFSGTGLSIVGSADNVTTYVLATFGASRGTFDPALVTGIPAGYTLVYNPTDIELVPTAIPEPATWGAAALAFLVVGYMQRKRIRGMYQKPVMAAAK